MSIFKRNLTSKILEDQSSLVISNKVSPIAILEVGCGNGNISLNLAKNFPSNKYYAKGKKWIPLKNLKTKGL